MFRKLVKALEEWWLSLDLSPFERYLSSLQMAGNGIPRAEEAHVDFRRLAWRENARHLGPPPVYHRGWRRR